MKLNIIATLLLVTFSFALLPVMAQQPSGAEENKLNGAWQANIDGLDAGLVFADGYCSFTRYSAAQKKFEMTTGGPFTASSGKINIKTEFHSGDKNRVGKSEEYKYTLSGDQLSVTVNGYEIKWKRADNADQNLAGNWRITQRKQGNEMGQIPLRARRTLKLMSSTRFQWMAINIETGEFSGTGGGIYTFKDGKYTEHIEFFSRDSSRVGMSLSFEGKLENGQWIHSGKSSKGDPIYEVWERMK